MGAGMMQSQRLAKSVCRPWSVTNLHAVKFVSSSTVLAKPSPGLRQGDQ